MTWKSLKSYLVLCYTIAIGITSSAAGQAGHLDNTFGVGGIATQQALITQLTNRYSVGGVAIQSDGKIVVVGAVPGSNSFNVPAVLRLSSNGQLDTSFGANGVFVLPNSFGSYTGVAIQSDGKILAGTSTEGTTAEVDRLTTTGRLDSSFGSGGRVSFQLASLLGMALQPDGRILASLQSFTGPSEVTRLLSNGSTDTSFGRNGVAIPPSAGSLEVLENSDILVFGRLVSRLTVSGALDTSFGVNGQLLAQNSAFASPSNGDILVAGTLISNPAVPTSGLSVFAYQGVGIGDPTFGQNGGAETPFAGFPTVTASGLGLESTGDIVELGTVSTRTTGAFGLVRYTPVGRLDTGFGSGGTVTTRFGTLNATVTACAIAIQSDDKIVVAGTVLTPSLHGQFNTELLVARYLGH
jgi:uncharacterized delta-60 repeat protein